MVKKKKRANRILATLLIFILALATISGCGEKNSSGNGNGQGENITEDAGSGKENGQQPEEGTAMGRYVENVTDLSDSLTGYGGSGLYKLSDGSLIISDTFSYFLRSKDNGTAWEEDDRAWLNRMREKETYIISIGVGADNTIGVIYNDDQTEEEDAEPTLNPKLLIIKPDGSEVPVDIATTEDDSYLYQVYVADNGRIFVTTMGSGNIYEVREDGSSELFLTLESGSRPELVQFQDDLMIMDGYGMDGILIYDMEKKEYIEDEVLSEFIHVNYKNRNSQSGSWYDMYFFPGEEDILYLAGAKGLYRHVIGGSAIEQVIDGSLCTFNNPAYGIIGMITLENNEFLALFTSGRLVHFVYDPDIPTVPTEKLKVYSLKENNTIRQAITLYQADNPAVYVEYEIGMEEGSSVTREDALKSLNTEIMAGEGPDVLLLDSMPVASYIEKGLLLDLDPVLNGLSGEDELFSNIVEAMKTNDKIYTIPCEIQLPMILGKDEYVSGAGDLKGIADAVEKLRRDNPEKDLIGICTEKGIMRLFAMVCEPGWIKENDDIDKEAITEFLTQTKRIYDAQMDGISEKTVEEYNSLNESYLQYYGVSRDDSDYLRTSVDAIGYIGNLSYMECGALTSPYSYANLISAERVEGFEDSVWSLMNGQADSVFCAQTLLGINAASKSTGQAQDFIKVCLGKANQSYLFNGFAVNKKAFEESFVLKEEIDENGVYSTLAMGNDEGLYIAMDVYWPNGEQIAELEKYIEAADTPYIKEDVLEEAVYEEGIAYIQGTQSLEEAVSNIEKKVAIYMAE